MGPSCGHFTCGFVTVVERLVGGLPKSGNEKARIALNADAGFAIYKLR